MTYNVFGGTLSLTQSINQSMHRFQVMADYWSNFRYSESEVSHFIASLGVTPANIAINDISLKTRFCGIHAAAESTGVSLITFT